MYEYNRRPGGLGALGWSVMSSWDLAPLFGRPQCMCTTDDVGRQYPPDEVCFMEDPQNAGEVYPPDLNVANLYGCVQNMQTFLTGDEPKRCETASGNPGFCFCCPSGTPRADPETPEAAQIREEEAQLPLPPEIPGLPTVEPPTTTQPPVQSPTKELPPEGSTPTARITTTPITGIGKILSDPKVWVAVGILGTAAYLGKRYFDRKREERMLFSEEMG
jgi:hypothetical protein